jgi:hypothetical protein
VRASIVCLTLLAAHAGCASGLRWEQGLYRHGELGYTIAAPPGPEGYWRRIRVERAELAFRGARGEAISLAARCGRGLASAKILARHLRIGTREHRMRSSEELEVDGRPAWVQVFDARADAATVRVKTLTLVAEACVYDWVLVAREGFEAAELRFDAWWSSFQLPPRASVGGAS